MQIPKPTAPKPAAPKLAAPISAKIQVPRPQGAVTSEGLRQMLHIQQNVNSGSSILKQNPAGTIRFRLLRPIVTADMVEQNPTYQSPLAVRGQHWYSKINADGKEGYGQILCYSSVGRQCPVCTLYEILVKWAREYPDLAVYTDRQNKGSLGLSRTWAGWVLDRGFMIGANAEYRPELDRIKELSVPMGVGEQMCNLMDPDRGGHGDASDPEFGYDFVVQGNNAAQKIQTKYTVLDKRGESYPYNPTIMQGKQPIFAKLESQLLTPDKLVEQFQLIFAGMAAYPGYEHVIEEFGPIWDDLCAGGDGFGSASMPIEDEEPMYEEEEYTPDIVSDDAQAGSLRGDAAYAEAAEEVEAEAPAPQMKKPAAAAKTKEISAPAPEPEPVQEEIAEQEGETGEEMVEVAEEVSAPTPPAPPAQMRGPSVRPAAPKAAMPGVKAPTPGAPAQQVTSTADRLASIAALKAKTAAKQ